MKIPDEIIEYYLQAKKVDFLTEKWERDWYALSLFRSAAWGKKIDKQNEEYFSKTHLVDKYNV